MNKEEVSILVVDDVNTMRVQVKDLLISFGFEKIAIIDNGEAAKAELSTGKYHLVLCDWHMTPINGLEVLKQIRAQPNTKDLAFIMVTAEGTKEKVIEAIKAGVDDYLVKPLTLEQIETKVHAVLTRKQVLS